VGKKRIKTIDLSALEKKEADKKKRVIGSGKQHGRIADTEAVMLEEMEKRREKAKTAAMPKPKAPKPTKKFVRQKKIVSKRYQELKKLVKPDKFYPLPEAVELLKKMATAQFEETVEIHLVTFDTGVLGKTELFEKSGKKKKVIIKTEKKFPLIHLKIGKVNWPKAELLENIQSLIKAISVNRVKKAVLTSTMGPGIKLSLEKS